MAKALEKYTGRTRVRSQIYAARRALGYTQLDIAQKVGIDRSYYTMIENGRCLPSLPTALAIHEALALVGDIRDLKEIWSLQDVNVIE